MVTSGLLYSRARKRVCAVQKFVNLASLVAWRSPRSLTPAGSVQHRISPPWLTAARTQAWGRSGIAQRLRARNGTSVATNLAAQTVANPRLS
jgi:hypothetical protein